MDWNILMVQFKAKYGADLCEEDLPAQSYFEEFEERLAEGNLEADRLSEIVSQEETDTQRRSKPDTARQYGMHLDGRLTLQTRRRFTSTEPRDIVQLRAKCTVMDSLWLLAQMRQPGRSIYSDLTTSTFSNFLKILWNKRNFKKEVDGQLFTKPSWAHCLSNEYELQKEALTKCRTTSMGIAGALESTYRDNEHISQHWVQLAAIANSSEENHAKAAKLVREVQELKSMVGRSRSPRMQPRQKALPGPQQLALPAPQSQKKMRRGRGAKKGTGKGGKNESDSTQFGGSSGSNSGRADFDQLMSMRRKVTSLFHPSSKDKPICRNFQKRQSADPKICNRRHVCASDAPLKASLTTSVCVCIPSSTGVIFRLLKIPVKIYLSDVSCSQLREAKQCPPSTPGSSGQLFSV